MQSLGRFALSLRLFPVEYLPQSFGLICTFPQANVVVSENSLVQLFEDFLDFKGAERLISLEDEDPFVDGIA